MHRQATNIIRVRLERRDLLMGIVVEYAKLEVVRARNEPVLASNELHTANRNLRDLECLNNGARFVVVDVDGAVVQPGEQPWLRWVKVDAFDAVRAIE